MIKAEFSGKSTFAYLLCHEYLLSPQEGVAFILNNIINEKPSGEATVNVTVLFSSLFKDTIVDAF